MKEVPIKGEIPAATNIPPGCRFHPRCLYAQAPCWQEAEPSLEEVAPGHLVACRLWKEIAAGTVRPARVRETLS
jgi:peptide/nickel transport system ATP-binding protein